MEIRSIRIVTFSPTGASLRSAKAIAEAFSCPVRVENITTTWPDAQFEEFHPQGLLIAAVPVYAGRIPAMVVSCLRRMRGNGAPACGVVTYGNRAYEDALLELCDLLEEDGFTLAGGAVFVAEHSISGKIASGRPSQEELAQGRAFGRQLAHKLESGVLSHPVIPGNRPYKDGKPAGEPMSPKTEESCIGCGVCAKGCPMQIISREDNKTILAPEKCIRCCACVKHCPVGAKFFDAPAFLAMRQRMEETFIGENHPEFYL